MYSTEGIILGHYDSGEADKIVSILTFDFGYVYAKSTGSRKITSKLRSNLADYTHGYFDVVRGHHGWKIIGASEIASLRGGEREAIPVIDNIARLLKKIAGEERNESLFLDTRELFYILRDKGKPDISLELYYVIRILYHLGYWDSAEREMNRDHVAKQYKSLLPEVNNAIDRAIN